VVVEAGNPKVARAKVLVGDDRTATPRFAKTTEPVPARINWLRWVTPSRVVVETNGQVPTGANSSLPGIIMAFEVDGSNARILVTPRDLREMVTTATRDLSVRDRSPIGPTVDDPFFSSGGTESMTAVARASAGDIGLNLASGGLFGPGNILGLLEAPGIDVVDPASGFGFNQNPLVPRVFDLDPKEPGVVLVRTSGQVEVMLHRLDTTTGKLKTIGSFPYESDRISLLDRQGRPRISAPATINLDFPHRLTLDRGVGHDRSRDLATAAGLAATPAAFTVSPENFFGERVVPLGFDENPAILYYASNIGRDTYAIYSADLASGKRTDLAIEHPTLDLIDQPSDSLGPDGVLVYDRHTRRLAGLRMNGRLRTTRWFAPELQAVQALLEQSLPGRNVDIIEWDAPAQRFIAAVSGPGDPGGFVIFDRATMKLAEFARRAPWLDALPRHRALNFDVEIRPGVEVACRLTVPTNPHLKPTPLVVICPPAPWERIPRDFQPEVQALAEMGFAVAQVDPPGAWGRGVKRREAIREGYDLAEVAEIVRIVGELARSFAIDPKRVALLGVGHGGTVALRALATQPSRFRCAVALEPAIDLNRWLAEESPEGRAVGPTLRRSYYGPNEWVAKNPLRPAAELVTQPLLMLSYPGPDGGRRRNTFVDARNFSQSTRSPEGTVQFITLTDEFAAGLPGAKAATFREIEGFLNTHLYDYTVKVGTPVVRP
jgi:pimeloyl-ACP methyl ester carboxylesterase